MILTMEHLQYTYDAGLSTETRALRDICVKVKSGEFIGIIGRTGSGKSTLIRHLNGLMTPSEGKIYCDGKDIHDPEFDLRSLRCKVGLVFQYPEQQLFESTVLRDVCFGPKNQGFTEKEAEEKAGRALSQTGVPEEFYHSSPFDLSGGLKRRVAIAGVLAMDPEILVLDEPTAGLDPAGCRRILELAARLNRERQIAVVLVSHSMEEIAGYARRLIVMHDGSILYDSTPEDVFSHEDRLSSVGLSVPRITHIMRLLKDRGVPVDTRCISIEEAKERILGALNLNGIQ